MTVPPTPTPTPTEERAPRNLLGIASLIVGAVTVLLGAVVSLVLLRLATTIGFDVYTAANIASGVLQGLLGLVGLGLGIAGLVSRNPRKAFAGAGTGIAAVVILQSLTTFAFAILAEL